jgi:hypothetical protein
MDWRNREANGESRWQTYRLNYLGNTY